MTVVNNRLTEEGGVAAGIKDQNLGSLNVDLGITSEMKEKVRVMFDNVINSLTTDCASLFGEIFTQILESLAPKICTHFNLVHHTAATTQLSQAMFTLRQTL